MKKIIILLIVSIILLGCSKEANLEKTDTFQKDIYFNEGINRVEPPVLAPDFIISNLINNSISLSDLKGKVIFLNFWASWCGPCTQEMPSIESLYQKTKDNNIEILTVNLGESKESIQEYIKKNSFNFSVIPDTNNEIAAIYGVRSIPTTYIIDTNGNIIAGKLGAHEWDNKNIQKILKELSE